MLSHKEKMLIELCKHLKNSSVQGIWFILLSDENSRVDNFHDKSCVILIFLEYGSLDDLSILIILFV